jgi:D-beta-D-heptose 7-phosphate kinase/D-beta-D-heptose 1-phosphate adenosyltransferase
MNIWTNGCFDILHIGHIELFKYAKSLGDRLIVGIDSDDRVKLLKGNNRPINNHTFRKQFLESIKYIDQVVIFSNEQDLISNIKNFNIDTIVVGDDYRDKFVIGSNLANVVFFNKIPNLSSSKIIAYVR